MSVSFSFSRLAGSRAAVVLAVFLSTARIYAAGAEPVGAPLAPLPLALEVNQSTVIENRAGIRRVSIANPDTVEVVAVNRNEILLNGKTRGATSLVLWDSQGHRLAYSVQVTGGVSKPDFVRDQIRQELPGQDIRLEVSEGSVVLKGTANDLVSADRAAALAGTLGKVVNLLNVKVPQAEPQILLKVRFANVNRSAASQLGFNLISSGATNTLGATSTGQFGTQPKFDWTPNSTTVTVNDLLNIFLFRKDLNLGATIQLLETKQFLQILAEPNLLTVSGRPASFLAGGEFPFPTLQGGGGGIGQITIQFREFGIRIKFVPTVTPRGTIRLAVMPEVSALDYANSLTIGGYTIPGLSTRRVQTEVELDSGQSFVIAGLLDNRTTEILNKMPGLSNIPLLGKLFESRSLQKNNTELMVLVTPELVDPITAAAKKPDVAMPKPFLKDGPKQAPQNPVSKDEKLPVLQSLPVEVIKSWAEPDPATATGNGPGPAPAKGPGDNNGTPPILNAKTSETGAHP